MFHNRKTTLLIVAVFLVSLGFVISPTMGFAEKANKCPCKYTSEKIVRNSYKFDTWGYEGWLLYGQEHLNAWLENCDSGDGVNYKLDMSPDEFWPDPVQIYYQCQIQSIDGAVLVNFYELIPADEPQPDWYEACKEELKNAGDDLFNLWGPPGESCD